MNPTRHVPRIALLCPGIGRVRRGMERSVAGIYEELHTSPGAEWHLLTGPGPAQGNRRLVPIFRREHVPGWITRIRPTGAFEIEQVAFFARCLPILARMSPAVIYCRDEILLRLLAAWKPIFLRRAHIIYGNGSPMPPPYPRSVALVQHLSHHGYRMALEANEPPDKQCFVPNAFPIPTTFSPTSSEAKCRLRQELGLPTNRHVLICVAAINRYHKRIDYLIHELALLPDPSVVLLLVGQQEAETPTVLAEGRAALGERLLVTSADSPALEAYYRAADAFVLPSCREAFGRVIVEALSLGLPTLVHNGPPFTEVAGPHGLYVDMARRGALADVLASPQAWRQDAETMAARHRWSYENYSWDRLKERYLEMFQTCLGR